LLKRPELAKLKNTPTDAEVAAQSNELTEAVSFFYPPH
jgi:hypothetical protein